jgi:hypothetical protein
VVLLLLGLALTACGSGEGQSPSRPGETEVSAIGSDESSDVPSREELLAIAAEASGRPGEIPPFCPSVSEVDALKRADIRFGPCLPVADDATQAERQAMLQKAAGVDWDAPPEKPVDASKKCVGFSERTSMGSIDASFPCGMEILEIEEDLVVIDGKPCLKVKLIDRTKESAEPVTRTVCGSKP